MRTAVIIPCRRLDYISDIVGKLLMSDADIVVAFDRVSCELPQNSRIHIVRNDFGDGFQAGRTRDIGLCEAEKHADNYIFIDDDCIPQDSLVESHSKWLSCSTPLITIGRRIEKQFRWMDKRELPESVGNLNLFDSRGTLVNNTDLIKKCLCIWTCNCGMNAKAVAILRRMMGRYVKTDRIFNPAFDGKWGGEDSFLSYMAWASHVNMFYLPGGQNGVVHKEHSRPTDTYNTDHVTLLNEEVSKLVKKLAVDKPQPDMFAC